MPFLFIFGVHVLKGLPILGFLKVNCACCKLQSISASIEGSIPENAAGWQDRLWLLEIALVLVRFDHVASRIINAKHGTVRYQVMPYTKIRRRPTRPTSAIHFIINKRTPI
jgi:hypothetical protein